MNFVPRLIAIISILGCGAHFAWTQTNTLTVNPSPVVFCGQPGQVISSVPVSVSSSGGPVTFLVSSVTSEGNWLEVDPSFATTTTIPSHQLVLSIAGGVIPLAVGSYNGQIVLASLDGARLATIPVSLQVSAAGCGAKSGVLFVNSGPVTLQVPPGANSSEYLYVFNTFPSNVLVVPWVRTSTDPKWLSTTGTNLTIVTGIQYPTPLGLAVNTAGLSAGTTYTGNIGLDSSNNAGLNIPVTLVVNASAGSAKLAATPSPLSIGIPLETAATSAAIQLTNLNSSAIDISTSSSTTGTNRNWLAVSPVSATLQPGATVSLTASISAAGLIEGANKASINVISGSGGSFTIPVTATFGINSRISSNPNPLSITTPVGATSPVSEDFTVSTNTGTVTFSATASSSVNQPWLSVKPFNTTVAPGRPGKLTVSVQPSLLPSGPAIGVITLTPSDGSAAVTIPVNVNAARDSTLNVTPAQLWFVYQTGGEVPPTQSVSLATTATNNYSVQAITSSGGNWLAVSPLNLGTNSAGALANLTAQVNPSGLAPNTYSGRIVITNASTGAQQMVPVTLTVAPPPSIAVSPASLKFNYQAGSAPTPMPQSIQLTSTGAAAFTVSTIGPANLLTVTPSFGNAPGTVMVALNTDVLATLPVGQYSAVVAIASPNIQGGTQAVSVAVNVSPIAPKPDFLVNAASLQTGPVSPGEIVTIFGQDLGPKEGVPFSLTTQGNVPAALGGTKVTFDGFPAPLIYAGSRQINAIVPYEIAGRAFTSVVVFRNDVASLPLTLQVTDTAPAIFSATQNGNGQGAILNADNSYNSANSPATAGSVIQIFATGEGWYPGASTGSVTVPAPPFPAFVTRVSVTIGGQPADIQYAGEAPGLISGMFQVNAVIPANTGSGPQPVVLKVGETANVLQTITVAVQ